MKTCDLCGHSITKWQSYEINGSAVQHLLCAIGRTPADHPTAHLSHFPSQFNQEDLRRIGRTRLVSDEGMVFDE